MIKLSIIVPSFNQSKYLEDCLESVYDQTQQAHEIIVVDDGSTDDSLEIARRFEFRDLPLISSPVRVVSQVNKGLASARNAGIMNATGDYVFFLDADDVLEENAVERLTSEIAATNADIVAPSFREFGLSNREVILGGFTMEDLKQANRLPYCCAVRRSALLEVGGYSPRMRWGWEDYALWFDLLGRGKSVAVLQEVLVNYRVKDRSMIHEANEHSEELWSQIRKDFPNIFR